MTWKRRCAFGTLVGATSVIGRRRSTEKHDPRAGSPGVAEAALKRGYLPYMGRYL